MAQFTFQEQLLSVMEVLAKAATEEINRRVADSCAVIRLELSRSQRDIDSLKRKCQVMENELRKVRGRGRRKGTKPFLSFINKFISIHVMFLSVLLILCCVFKDLNGNFTLKHIKYVYISTEIFVFNDSCAYLLVGVVFFFSNP